MDECDCAGDVDAAPGDPAMEYVLLDNHQLLARPSKRVRMHHQREETKMTIRASQPSRRRFIKNSVVSLAAVPFANTLPIGPAQAADAVSESDPMATALGYKMDATKASNRKDNTAVCGNCSLYSGKPGTSDGPCSVFGGKLVNAKGWCSAWVKKA